MRTESISPRHSTDLYSDLTDIIDEIGRDMDTDALTLVAPSRPLPAILLLAATPTRGATQVFDRSALLWPPAPMPPHCGVCKSYREETSECRRYAPFLRGPANKLVTKWPDVSPADHCGEFEA